MARLPITDSQGNYNTNQGGNPVPSGYDTRNTDGRFSPSTPNTLHQNTGVLIDNGDGTYLKKDLSTGEYVRVNVSGEKVDRKGVKIDNVRNYKTDYIFAHYIRNYNNPYFNIAGVTILYTQKELEGLTIDEKVQYCFDTLLCIKQQLQDNANILGGSSAKLSDILSGVGGISTAVGGLVTGITLASTLTGIGGIVTGLAAFFSNVDFGASDDFKNHIKDEALKLTEYYGKVAEYYVMYLDAQKKGQNDVDPADLAKNGIQGDKGLFSSLFTTSNSIYFILVLLIVIGLYVYNKKRKGGRK